MGCSDEKASNCKTGATFAHQSLCLSFFPTFSLAPPTFHFHDAHSRHQGLMFQCDICQMSFSQKANMHRHRMRHNGVKPYECRHCKKRFFRKDQMQEHSMTHIRTGIDFACPVAFCTHHFSQYTTLRSHLDESHNISTISQVSCKCCSLIFTNTRRLLLHYQAYHDDEEVNVVNFSSVFLQFMSCSLQRESILAHIT
ncbi:unnamed protein product [Haemonchus placei]|uniref:C2H2-type domain-containing protein n=1 Tax=Haemonchus placei TaxID=6290 RepID=A0A0N4X0C7_HAEPC|nr:unnamed protein product [Haemonchus placei]